MKFWTEIHIVIIRYSTIIILNTFHMSENVKHQFIEFITVLITCSMHYMLFTIFFFQIKQSKCERAGRLCCNRFDLFDPVQYYHP